jgi:CheY-like chemotaxis protein
MPRMLVIDDDARDRAFVHDFALPTWEIIEASSGIAGLEILSEQHQLLDLVLLDIAMPQIDGQWIFLQIRMLNPALRIIPFTGLKTALPLLRTWGCSDILTKPIRPAQFQATIMRILAQPWPALRITPETELLKQQSDRIVAAARPHWSAGCVLVFSTTPFVRMGLASLIRTSISRDMITTIEVLNLQHLATYIQTLHATCLVVDAVSYPEICPIGATLGIPVILVAGNPTEAQSLQYQPHAILVSTDLRFTEQLIGEIEQLVR